MLWTAKLTLNEVVELGYADLPLRADPVEGHQDVREPCKMQLHFTQATCASDPHEHIANLAGRACISNDFAALLQCCQAGRNLFAIVQLKCDCFRAH